LLAFFRAFAPIAKAKGRVHAFIADFRVQSESLRALNWGPLGTSRRSGDRDSLLEFLEFAREIDFWEDAFTLVVLVAVVVVGEVVVEAGLGVEIVVTVELEFKTARDESLFNNIAGANFSKSLSSETRAWQVLAIVPECWVADEAFLGFAHAWGRPLSLDIWSTSLHLLLVETSARVGDDSSLFAVRVARSPLTDSIWRVSSRSAVFGHAPSWEALSFRLCDCKNTGTERVVVVVSAWAFYSWGIDWRSELIVAADHGFCSGNDGESALVLLVALLESLSALANACVTCELGNGGARKALVFSSLWHLSERVDALGVAVLIGADWASVSHLGSWAVAGADSPLAPLPHGESRNLASGGFNLILDSGEVLLEVGGFADIGSGSSGLSGARARGPGRPFEELAAGFDVALLFSLADEVTASVDGLDDSEGVDAVDHVVAVGTALADDLAGGHWWLLAQRGLDLVVLERALDGIHNTADGISLAADVLVSAGSRVAIDALAIEWSPWSPSGVASAWSFLDLIRVDVALVLSESSLDTTAAIGAGTPGGPEMPVADFTAVLSAVGVGGSAFGIGSLTEVVELSESHDTSVETFHGALGIVPVPLRQLWSSVNSAGFSSGEFEGVAVSVGSVDSLGVARVRSSENTVASALPDLVVAVCQLLAVAFNNSSPWSIVSVDWRNNLGLFFDFTGALLGSASFRHLFNAAGIDGGPGSPGRVLGAAREGDSGL